MWWWIVQNGLVSGLLAAVVAVACRLGRFSPAVKHALWLLVLMKLITPPIGAYRLPQAIDQRLRRLADHRWPLPLDVETANQMRLAPQPDQEQRVPRLIRGEVKRDAEPIVVEGNRVEDGSLPASQWAFVAWLLGAMTLASVQFTKLVHLWRLLRHSTSAPAWLDQVIQQTAARLKVRPPQVAVVPVLCSPLVAALGKPRLLWPAALERQLTPEACATVLLHELAHLRRRDHWVAWLELLAGIAWWFNPVYWYVRYQLHESAEMACDAWVIALLPERRRAAAGCTVLARSLLWHSP